MKNFNVKYAICLINIECESEGFYEIRHYYSTNVSYVMNKDGNDIRFFNSETEAINYMEKNHGNYSFSSFNIQKHYIRKPLNERFEL